MYRPGTKLKRTEVQWILTEGGIGDNVCRAPALLNELELRKEIHFVLWCEESSMEELYKNWFGDHPRINFIGAMYKGPHYAAAANSFVVPFKAEGFFRYHRMHMVDHAYGLICGRLPKEEERNYVPLRLEKIDISRFELPENYVVMTCGHTWGTREFDGEAAAKTVEYFEKRDLPVVFLGNKELSRKDSVQRTKLDYSRGIDLTGQTSILEAAKVMGGSRLVYGVDQGLLHVAACADEDVPIVAGYTITRPDTRMPIRKNGFHNVYPVTPDLPCRFCMTNQLRFGHNFKFCPYGDAPPPCVGELTIDKWITAFEEALGGVQ